MASDVVMAWLDRATGLGLPDLFFLSYLVSVALFVLGTYWIGGRLYRSPWAIAAFGLALTLRHRIVKTGVNTFEGYFHTRILAFGIGMVAVGALLRGRRTLAAVLVASTFALHPTTAAWFAVWLGVALVTTSRRPWRWAAAGTTVVVGAGLLMLWLGPLAGRLTIMDPAWMATLAERDYLFPTSEWGLGAWAANLAPPAVMFGVYRLRRRDGLVSPEEAGLFFGCIALLAIFAASLPLVAAHLALAVQLQVSRVLWMVDLVATAYLVWAVAESPWPWLPLSASVRTRALVAALTITTILRGAYILRVEHHNRLIEIDLPSSPWQEAADWASRHTPEGASFLADPEQVWKYGVSFRVAARRDVFVEVSKDPALGIYSRDVAMRVDQRRRLIGNFNEITADRVLALARDEGLDYLIVDRRFPLPSVYDNGQIFIYSLSAR